jgi:hypothetical protein
MEIELAESACQEVFAFDKKQKIRRFDWRVCGKDSEIID